MRFNLDNLNPTTRFFFDDDKPDEGWVDIHAAPMAVQSDIANNHSKKRVEFTMNPKTRRMERIPFVDTDDDAVLEALWDYAISDWLLLTPTGEPIPCTRENKIMLMRGDTRFNSFINSCLEKLNALEESDIEEAEKNS